MYRAAEQKSSISLSFSHDLTDYWVEIIAESV